MAKIGHVQRPRDDCRKGRPLRRCCVVGALNSNPQSTNLGDGLLSRMTPPPSLVGTPLVHLLVSSVEAEEQLIARIMDAVLRASQPSLTEAATELAALRSSVKWPGIVGA